MVQKGITSHKFQVKIGNLFLCLRFAHSFFFHLCIWWVNGLFSSEIQTDEGLLWNRMELVTGNEVGWDGQVLHFISFKVLFTCDLLKRLQVHLRIWFATVQALWKSVLLHTWIWSWPQDDNSRIDDDSLNWYNCTTFLFDYVSAISRKWTWCHFSLSGFVSILSTVHSSVFSVCPCVSNQHRQHSSNLNTSPQTQGKDLHWHPMTSTYYPLF